MKRIPIIFLQAVVILIGVSVFVWMLWEPWIEGRNVNATVFQIYFNDPFLVYAYTASIAFFVAVYQASKLLGYIGQDKIFSPNAVKAVRTIKRCAITIICFIVPAVAYLFIVRSGDDIAGGVAMGLMIIFFSLVITTSADIFERILQSVTDMKSKNDPMV